MEHIYLPVLPIRGTVVFPSARITFDIGREQSRKAVEAAMSDDRMVFIIAQRDDDKDEIEPDDLFSVGTISKIEQVLQLPGGAARIIAVGAERAYSERIDEDGGFMHGLAEILKTDECDENEKEACLRVMQDEYKKLFSVERRIGRDKYMEMLSIRDPEVLCDTIASQMRFELSVKQKILEELNLTRRVVTMLKNMNREVDIAELENQIGIKVRQRLDKNQREFYLREQLKVIAEELGEGEDTISEADEYRRKIKALRCKKSVKEKLFRDVDRFVKMNSSSADGTVMRTYLDTVLELPWNKKTKENLDISNVQAILDEDHYGLGKVKERITEYLAVKALKGGSGQILCLSGPPGVGKTSVAKSIARALGRNFVQISLGGIHDEADIRGHRKTYIGAMPGRIMEAVARAESRNALILLDEIDKMGADYKGDPSAALLEVLDAEQNNAFRDHYIEVPFDLSGVMFIATANTCHTLSAPLLDRLEIIELSGYTTEEKINIAQRYLIPRAIENTGLSEKNIKIEANALREIIEYYTREAGVRQLERELTSICRKTAKLMLTENKKSTRITENNVKKYIGSRRFGFELMNDNDEVGVARGLAWTAVGGDTLSIEVNVMPGTGKTELTGKLGDVMKESARAALSYIRSKSNELGIETDFYKTKDLHIHVPEGAVPKDGPSAGITIATAVASALTGVPVRRDVAMTGEITLRGRVLPIGGLKEKSLAAYRAGIKNIIIPAENKKDIDEIQKDIRKKISFVPVGSMDEVLKFALRRQA